MVNFSFERTERIIFPVDINMLLLFFLYIQRCFSYLTSLGVIILDFLDWFPGEVLLWWIQSRDHHVIKIQIYLVKAQTFFDSLDVYWSAWWLS